MELAKKNLVSIICGVIALVAVGSIFYPIKGWYLDLQKKVADRAGVSDALNRIATKPRNQPPLDPFAPSDPKPLDVFPTKQVIESWTAAIDKLKADSAEVWAEAIKMSAREPLYPGALPIGDTSGLIGFKNKYRELMDFTTPAARLRSMPVTVLNAGFLPTDVEVNEERQRVEQDFIRQFGNDPALANELKSRRDAVQGDLRQKVAEGSQMYIDTTGVLDAWQPLLIGGATPEPQTIYIAQLGYWIQKDVFESLAAANKGSKSVRESAVKHLHKFKFASSAFTKLSGSGAPPAATGDATQWPQPNFAVSITGRDTNPIYDIYRFSIAISADAEQVPRILQELSRGKFITVTNCGIQTIDSGARQAKGLYYSDKGDKPIVYLDIDGEALLLREWTKPLMPPTVRTALGIPPDQPKPQ